MVLFKPATHPHGVSEPDIEEDKTFGHRTFQSDLMESSSYGLNVFTSAAIELGNLKVNTLQLDLPRHDDPELGATEDKFSQPNILEPEPLQNGITVLNPPQLTHRP